MALKHYDENEIYRLICTWISNFMRSGSLPNLSAGHLHFFLYFLFFKIQPVPRSTVYRAQTGKNAYNIWVIKGVWSRKTDSHREQ